MTCSISPKFRFLISGLVTGIGIRSSIPRAIAPDKWKIIKSYEVGRFRITRCECERVGKTRNRAPHRLTHSQGHSIAFTLGDLETLSLGGRGKGEGQYESEISHLKLVPMRRSLGISKMKLRRPPNAHVQTQPRASLLSRWTARPNHQGKEKPEAIFPCHFRSQEHRSDLLHLTPFRAKSKMS